MEKKKIPLKNIDNDIKAILKWRLDQKGYNTWKKLTDEIGEENPRVFTDWFNGNQLIKKDVLEKAFDILEIPKELIEIYTEPVIRYRLKK